MQTLLIYQFPEKKKGRKWGSSNIFLYILHILICVDFSIPPFLCTALAVWHKAIAYSLLLEEWTFSSWKCNYSVIWDPKLIISFDNKAIIERKVFLLQSNVKKKSQIRNQAFPRAPDLRLVIQKCVRCLLTHLHEIKQ